MPFLDGKPVIITKRNIDKHGNPISVRQVETKQVVDIHNSIPLNYSIDRNHPIVIEDLHQIYNKDEISENTFWADYDQGILYFHPKLVGKSLTITYMGTGYILISSDRIYRYNKGDGTSATESIEASLEKLENILNTITQGGNIAGNIEIEVIGSRTDAQGQTFSSLGDRLNYITAQLDNVDSQLDNSATKLEVDVERKRIDNLSKLEEGSTTGDAELQDIRVGANGVVYDNAGNAVREQIKILDGNIENIGKSFNIIDSKIGNYLLIQDTIEGELDILKYKQNNISDIQLTNSNPNNWFDNNISNKNLSNNIFSMNYNGTWAKGVFKIILPDKLVGKKITFTFRASYTVDSGTPEYTVFGTTDYNLVNNDWSSCNGNENSFAGYYTGKFFTKSFYAKTNVLMISCSPTATKTASGSVSLYDFQVEEGVVSNNSSYNYIPKDGYNIYSLSEPILQLSDVKYVYENGYRYIFDKFNFIKDTKYYIVIPQNLSNLRITLNTNKTENSVQTIKSWGSFNKSIVEFVPTTTGDYYLDIWSNESDSQKLNLKYLYVSKNKEEININLDSQGTQKIKSFYNSTLILNLNNLDFEVEYYKEYISDKYLEINNYKNEESKELIIFSPKEDSRIKVVSEPSNKIITIENNLSVNVNNWFDNNCNSKQILINESKIIGAYNGTWARCIYKIKLDSECIGKKVIFSFKSTNEHTEGFDGVILGSTDINNVNCDFASCNGNENSFAGYYLDTNKRLDLPFICSSDTLYISLSPTSTSTGSGTISLDNIQISIGESVETFEPIDRDFKIFSFSNNFIDINEIKDVYEYGYRYIFNKFNFVSGNKYYIAIPQNLSNLRVALNSNITENPVQIIKNWGSFTKSVIEFTPTNTGDYYLDVWSNASDSQKLDLKYLYVFSDCDILSLKDLEIKSELLSFGVNTIVLNEKLSNNTIYYDKDETIEYSKCGTAFRKNINNNGEIELEPLLKLPSDFPKFTVRGKSRTKGNYSVQMAHSKYAFMLNEKGQVVMFIKSKDTDIALLQKHIVSDGEVLYSYLRFMNNEDSRYPKLGTGIGYEQVEMIILDEKLNRIGEPIKCKAHNHIEADYPAEFHDSLVLDKNHYMIISYHARTVTNVTGREGLQTKILEAVIQEQKDGKVVFQWASGDYKDLYSDSYCANDFSQDYQDYAHINSIEIDPKDNNIIASFRHLGVMKINRVTGQIMWKLGGKSDDFGLTGEQLFSYQHDARITDEGTLSIFANNNELSFAGDMNSKDNVSRILEFKLD